MERPSGVAVDFPELEGLAVEAYRRLGLDPERPTSAFRIARLLLGPEAISRPPHLVGPPAATFVLDGRRRIAVKACLPIAYATFFCAHEIAHAIVDEERIVLEPDELELACDYLGACLVAPRPAVLSAHRAVGFDLSELAATFVASETLCALRVGEVLRLPLAVVAPTVRVRGPEEWVWPDEATLRAWARRAPAGVARTKLTDDPRRVVLRAG